MKSIFYCFILLQLFFSGVIYAQNLRESQVPMSVRDSFRKKFANTYVYEWEFKRKKQLYEAEFVFKGNKYDAYFSPDGKWIRTEREIKIHELPIAITQALATTAYRDWKIDDIEEHQTPEYPLFYQIEIEKGKQEMYLYFLPDGKLMNK